MPALVRRATPSDARDTAPHACDVCGHDAAAHDPISRRYCAATLTNALSRDCICT
ncbi:RGCVC family protein [Cryptosporangium arvum]|uniref:RGCVC family protein n=1 Tax=Cryptosporangium arvum TaxID=80871 RepID=UPI003CCBC880